MTTVMDVDALDHRYRDLQQFAGWTESDAQQVQSVADLLEPFLPAIVEDFYAAIDRHPHVRRIMTGGPGQIQRLKGTLTAWLQQLLRGPYDRDYVAARRRAGCRHAEIGLDQVYVTVALSRLRGGLARALDTGLADDHVRNAAVKQALNTLLDLDLAIIEDAYQAEHVLRQERVERLATIGQVAGGVAHELRNPLNVVKTSVYYLLNARNATPEKRAEHLTRIERHVHLADGVITALSSFAKMPAPTVTPIPAERVVAEALEFNPPPENVRTVLNLPADLPPVLADADQLRIVFANLVRNACEAMPSGGTLTISATAPDGHVEVAVADTGVGIKPEDQIRVLEPLFSTKARGLGLGLSIARAILDKNQGRLRLRSAPGRGTTFTVRLTAAEGLP
jgi:signal transduction histidine kinase